MSDKFHDTLLTAILDEERFVEAVFQGPQRGACLLYTSDAADE